MLSSCGSNKGIVKNKAPMSQADYPYIDAFHKGMQYKVQGRVDEAILEFEKCIRIKQTDDAVYYALAKLELERGNSDKSAEYIMRANAIDPDNTWYVEELAYMYFELEDYPNAVKSFQKLVSIEPKNIDWMYGLSEALMKNGQDKDAIQVFNNMEAQVGSHPHFAIQRYQILMRTGKVNEAEQELLNAKKKFPQDPSIIGTLVDHYFRQKQNDKAEIFLEELVEADPGNGRAHLALADIYQRRNELDKAYKSLGMAIASEDLDIDTKMNILISIQESSPEIPMEMFPIVDRFVEVNGDNAKSHSIKGDYLLQSGDSEGALISYKQALSIDKSLYPIWNQVLVMEYQNEDFESLYQDSKACLELFPSIASIYLLNGISANRLENYNEGVDILSLGMEMVVNDPPMKAEFYGQLGEAYFGMNDNAEMISSYKKAIALDPQSALLKNNFARRLASSKQDLDLALSLAEQVTTDFPEEDIFLDTRGWVLFQKGEYQEALKWFEKALVSNSKNSAAWEHLGDAFYKLNNVQDAVQSWEDAKLNGANSKLLDKKIADKKFYE